MREVGRYTLYDEIASGGMATVYLARQRAELGFSRVVAVKMLHAHYAREEAFRAMFLDEARLVTRIRHPNVVATLDVVEDSGELLLVMDYVHGETLARLLRTAGEREEPVPLGVAVAIVGDVLEGLHAAHEAKSETGEPLQIVHRDVSPQNVLVAEDGAARVADFGVAKAVGRLAEKYSNQAAKGKAGYMPPEQMRGRGDRRSDVYAAGVVLWETLVGERLFTGDSFLEIVTKALDAPIPLPSRQRAEVGAALDAVVMRAVSRDPAARFATAREMAVALEAAFPRASARQVGEWVGRVAKEVLDARRAVIERIESGRVIAGESAAQAAPPSSPSIETVSGVAPSRPAMPSRSFLPWAAGGVVLAAVATLSLIEMRRSPAPVVIVQSPAPTQPPSADIIPFPLPPAQVPPTLPSVAAPHVTRPATATHTATAPTASVPVCSWVELPDKDGIMIPKKVCR